MGKFFGKVGYAESEETAPGVWTDSIVERDHYGDVLKNTRRLESGSKINSDLNVDKLISIVSDAYADQNFSKMRYIKWMGAYWEIPRVEVNRPRLILTIGGVYNGPKA